MCVYVTKCLPQTEVKSQNAVVVLAMRSHHIRKSYFFLTVAPREGVGSNLKSKMLMYLKITIIYAMTLYINVSQTNKKSHFCWRSR